MPGRARATPGGYVYHVLNRTLERLAAGPPAELGRTGQRVADGEGSGTVSGYALPGTGPLAASPGKSGRRATAPAAHPAARRPPQDIRTRKLAASRFRLAAISGNTEGVPVAGTFPRKRMSRRTFQPCPGRATTGVGTMLQRNKRLLVVVTAVGVLTVIAWYVRDLVLLQRDLSRKIPMSELAREIASSDTFWEYGPNGERWFPKDARRFGGEARDKGDGTFKLTPFDYLYRPVLANGQRGPERSQRWGNDCSLGSSSA